MITIGIDPGITGAVAVIRDGKVTEVFDTPTEEIKKGKTTKGSYLPSAMTSILAAYPDAHVFIEKVSAMPGQGVTSMFGFGMGYGIWLGIIATLGLRHEKITPQAWKKTMMKGKGDKDASRGRAMELFPETEPWLRRKKDHGRAEAILLCAYGETLRKP